MKELAPYLDIMEKCSHCAFCESTCPVFLEDLLETHVARSRIELIKKALVNKELPKSKRFKEIVNRCLLCTNCTQTCPAKVPVDEIVMAARHQLYDGKRMNMVKRYLVEQGMQNRGITGIMKKLVTMAKTFGVKNIPDIPEKRFDQLFRGVIPAVGEKRGTVAYYAGCVTNTLYPDTGQSVITVLTQNGFDVIIPDKLTCCGIPALGEGDPDTAAGMMKNNIEILSRIDADAVVTDCTTCGMVFKEKVVKILDGDTSLADRAKQVAAKVVEVTDFLSQQGLSRKPGPVRQTCTYHVPCHRGWNPTLADAPRNILSNVPELNFVEMEFPEKCCGAGGAFYLENKALSGGICEKKTADITSTGADIVVTQCPSCRLFLEMKLDGKMKVMHPISILAAGYRVL